jgi:transposase
MWERIPPAAQAYIRALESRVAALAATVQPWREQVPQTSRTSSRPPSSDPPQALGPRPRRAPTGRRPGGQPGHAGQARALVPAEAGDVVVPVQPARCHHCQPPVPGEEPPPQRQQVTEIPPMQPVVTADQVHHVVCPACGEETRAEGPAGVPTGGVGPRVQASTARCPGADQLANRTTPRALEDRFGVQLGLGTIATLEHATVQAVAEPVAAARAYVPRQPAADLEATGGRARPPRAWLGTAVTAWVTGCVVRAARGGQVAQERLGERGWGWLVTDRWSGDTWSPPWRRPGCGAPLRRDIDAMLERGGRSREMGEAGRGQARQMCQWWHRVRAGTLAHTTFAGSMGPVRRAVEHRLEAGQTCGVPKPEGTCRERRKLRQALWTFVRHDGVAPTNNAAERALRPGGLWRKGRFGTHSAQGSRVVEAMMTVVATLKPQHRHVLASVTAAGAAALWGEPAPSLIPTPADSEQGMRPAA